MKKYILVSALLASQLAFADQLPASWNNESDAVGETALANFENTFDTHSEIAANLVEKGAGPKKWEMFGYVTTFGVSASGKIGLLASSGSSAVEIYWRKKPLPNPVVNKTALVSSTVDDITEGDVVINDSVSVDESVDEVLSVVKTRKEIRITDKLKDQIRNEISNLRNTSMAIEAMEASADFNFNWFVKMLRLDLVISGEGALTTPAITVGGELAIRIFWTRTTKKNPAVNTKAVGVLERGKFAVSIAKILAAVETVNIDQYTQEAKKQGFALETIRLGLGVSVSGDVVVGKGTGLAMMNVFFAKKPTPVVLAPRPQMAGDILVENEQGNVLGISNTKFSKGLIKSFKMSEKIVSKAARKTNRKFEPFIIWNIFAFTRGGSVGLAKVNGVGHVHLFFNKK